MTGKQIKRDFKKYLVDTKIEYREKNSQLSVNNFVIDFTDDYLIIYVPSSALSVTRINLYYSDAHSVFIKMLRYHLILHKKGLHIQGRVRTLRQSKRQTYTFQ